MKASKITELAMLPVTIIGAFGVASHFFPEWMDMRLSLSTSFILVAVGFSIIFLVAYIEATRAKDK